ncbi:MAG: T9SS type A sorting domain-containing protein [Flavobacteriales bacterium]
MKTIYALTILCLVSWSSFSQQFEWAELIDNPGALEVAGMDINTAGETYLTGIYTGIISYPFQGEAYVTKTDSEGNMLWTKYLGSDIILGDLITVGEDVIIVGQSYDVLQCNGLVFAESLSTPSMFLIKFHSDGSFGWLHQFTDREGQLTSLDEHNGTVALQCHEEFNTNSHIMYFDTTGNQLNDINLSDYAIRDVAMYNNWTYVAGQTSSGQDLETGNVLIPADEEGIMAFTLAIDSTGIAQWAHSDISLNAVDSKIEANEHGIYSFQHILDVDILPLTSSIWKLNSSGELLEEVNPPQAVGLGFSYPDLAISDCHVSLFSQNSGTQDSQELLLYDLDLELIDEKEIAGSTGFLSGQVATHENQILVSHVHTDNLDFNGEQEIIDFLDDAFQYPYLAKVAVSETCGSVTQEDCEISSLSVERLECVDGEFMINFFFDYSNTSDSFYVEVDDVNFGTFAYDEDEFLIGPFAGDGTSVYDLVLTDSEHEDCSVLIGFGARNCPSELCAVENLIVSSIECDSDSTYQLTFNAEIINGPTDSVEVTVNLDYQGLFGISDLPLTLSGISPGEQDEDIILVCASGLNACCNTTSYAVPECFTDNIPDINLEFLIYPNPVSETLFIKSDVYLSASIIVIYDSTGREVLVQSGMVDQISVAELASGVYQVVVFEGDKRVLAREIVKN